MNDGEDVPRRGALPNHPCGLPYVTPETLSWEAREAMSDFFRKSPLAILFGGVVNRVTRKVVSQKRLLVIASQAIYQYTIEGLSVNRFVPILEISKILHTGAWMGIVCPTQYDIYVQFPDAETCQRVLVILRKLKAFLKAQHGSSHAELEDRQVGPRENMKELLKLAKPNDWRDDEVKCVKIMKQKQVQDAYEARLRGEDPPVGTSPLDADLCRVGSSFGGSYETDGVLSRSRGASRVTVKDTLSSGKNPSQPPELFAASFHTELAPTSPGHMARMAAGGFGGVNNLDSSMAAQMEAEIDSLAMVAAEWEKKASVLKIRETQLESQLRVAQANNSSLQAELNNAQQELATLRLTSGQQERECEMMRKERRAASEVFGVDPDGDVSLTEAARRLYSVHDGLTDNNWRLTKEVASLEKRLQNVSSGNHASLEADAKALQGLIQLRAGDVHAINQQKTDAKMISSLTRQLHKAKQDHEETKLVLFDLQQKHTSLELRFKEHSTVSKAALKNLEKKLKEEGRDLPENRPRFSTSLKPVNPPGSGPRYAGGGLRLDSNGGGAADPAAVQPAMVPAEFAIGTRVVIPRANSDEVVGGVIRYLGKIVGSVDDWLGIELDNEDPVGNNGSVNGKVYFTTKPGRGVFLRPEAVLVEHAQCATCSVRHQRTNPAAPSTPYRGSSRSRSVSAGAQQPPPYMQQPSNEYFQLSLSLTEQLSDAEERIKLLEAQLHLLQSVKSLKPVPDAAAAAARVPPSPARSPSPRTKPVPPTPPPEYQRDAAEAKDDAASGAKADKPATSRRERSRSRGRSTSPQPPEPYEAAMREALSSCVASLKTGMPKPSSAPTAADIIWARKKTVSEGL